MYTWKSDDLLVADDTLLLCNLSKGCNRVPSHTPDGHPIRHVANDAVAGCDRGLIIEEGIQTVNNLPCKDLQLPASLVSSNVFDVAGQEANRMLIWRRLTPDQWQSAVQSSVTLGNGQRVYTGTWEALGLSFRNRKPLLWVPDGADCLLYTPMLLSAGECATPFPCIGLPESAAMLSPAAMVMNIVQGRSRSVTLPAAEKYADHFMRSTLFDPNAASRHSLANPKRRSNTPGCDLVLLDPPIPCRGSQDVLVCMRVITAEWYHCTAQPVMYKGSQYYIGCLNHLQSITVPYVRYELAVFTKQGLVSDRALTEAVYAKYVLMSIV